ncbi:diguanylate cyclase (GGDEF) domain-containing protein [Palleronia salina]|uniref:Diguanylate cyclase (GGDEF) domain-containing protein n=1 Tax=Palleronia salina TaxID=313368 RepID=A0A1M6L3J1_9RHOB|nr:GGDEF domain-containing protein [Palleronia salina]SHJ65742.1 diguanylate cyclase (GGDEF) domain-containing protein [Palleronia salina]
MTGQAAILAERAAFDALLPMHARLAEDGTILHVGPGLARLAGARQLLGQRVTRAFRVTRPDGVASMADMMTLRGRAMRLEFARGRPVRLKGMLVPFDRLRGSMLSLSLALSDLPDLGGAPLTARDFAPTDPTVDMLYLIEANAAAQAESRRLIARLDGAKSTAERQAFTDTLTGPGNRRALDRVLARLLGEGVGFSVIQLDLDRFKQVNDRHGHAAGDAVLCHVAHGLRRAVRAVDTVVRTGGDEFVVVASGLTEPHAVTLMAERILSEIAQPLPDGDADRVVSASVGCAISSRYARPDAARLLAAADAAAYAAKRAGGGLFRLHPGDGRGAGPDRRDRARRGRDDVA